MLTAAVDEVLRTHKSSTFPQPAQIIEACQKISETAPIHRDPEPREIEPVYQLTASAAREFMEVYHKLEKQAENGEAFRFNGLDINPQAGNRIRGLARAMYERNRSEYDRLTGDQP